MADSTPTRAAVTSTPPEGSVTPRKGQAGPRALPATGSRGHGAGSSRPPSRERDVEEDLQYLASQHVCSTLEAIVKQLLKDRPQDPTLAICNFLRSRTHQGSLSASKDWAMALSGSGGARDGRHTRAANDEPAAAGAALFPSNAERERVDRPKMSEVDGDRVELAKPDSAAVEEVRCPSPTSPLNATRSPDAAASPSRVSSPDRPAVLTLQHASESADEALKAMKENAESSEPSPTSNESPAAQESGARPPISPSSTQPPAAAVASGPRPGSSSSAASSVLRHATKPRGATNGIHPAYRRESLPHAVGAPLQHRALERDESTRSEASVFSVSSVDMHEFIAEFRTAHQQHFPTGGEYISRDDLAEIVDGVNLPLPDIRLLADLFAEIDVADVDLIRFDAFLARLSYRIQGRFNGDVVRSVFLGLPRAGNKGTAAEPPRVSDAEVAAAVPQESSVATTTHYSGSAAGAQQPTVTNHSPPPSAPKVLAVSAQATTPLPDATVGVRDGDGSVPLQRCLEDGLRGGLGLGVTDIEFGSLIHRLGIQQQPVAPERASAEAKAMQSIGLHDFLRVVSAVTGQTVEELEAA